MSAAGIVRALWPALRRILIRIGRWVLDDLLEDGVRFVARYLRKRVKVFQRRLGRVKAKWRQRCLRRRIRRYLGASAWLDEHAGSLSKRALRLVEPLAEKIPETSPWERERRAAA